jgi:prepilin-type N-terminal cleavage/methylation domain-containing protein
MPRRGFTIVELLTVIGIISLLLGTVLAALSAVRSADEIITSQHHMRQIAQWMDQWSTERNDVVLPASFDLRDEEGTDPGVTGGRRFYTGYGDSVNWLDTNIPWQASSGDPRGDLLSQGTWSDMLWVDMGIGDVISIGALEMHMLPDAQTIFADSQWSQPGRWLYHENPNDRRNPLRSSGSNSYHYPRFQADGALTVDHPHELGTSVPPVGMPLPFGAGAWEKDFRGFFAANNFFEGRSLRDRTDDPTDSNRDPRWTLGQIKAPSRSMYLVDSFAGETVGGAPDEETYREDTTRSFAIGAGRGEISTQEVDFRYDGRCLMLLLDGSVRRETPWGTLEGLQGSVRDGPQDDQQVIIGRGIRVSNLHRRSPW